MDSTHITAARNNSSCDGVTTGVVRIPIVNLGNLSNSSGALLENLSVDSCSVPDAITLYSSNIQELSGIDRVSVRTCGNGTGMLFERGAGPDGNGTTVENVDIGRSEVVWTVQNTDTTATVTRNGSIGTVTTPVAETLQPGDLFYLEGCAEGGLPYSTFDGPWEAATVIGTTVTFATPALASSATGCTFSAGAGVWFRESGSFSRGISHLTVDGGVGGGGHIAAGVVADAMGTYSDIHTELAWDGIVCGILTGVSQGCSGVTIDQLSSLAGAWTLHTAGRNGNTAQNVMATNLSTINSLGTVWDEDHAVHRLNSVTPSWQIGQLASGTPSSVNPTNGTEIVTPSSITIQTKAQLPPYVRFVYAEVYPAAARLTNIATLTFPANSQPVFKGEVVELRKCSDTTANGQYYLSSGINSGGFAVSATYANPGGDNPAIAGCAVRVQQGAFSANPGGIAQITAQDIMLRPNGGGDSTGQFEVNQNGYFFGPNQVTVSASGAMVTGPASSVDGAYCDAIDPSCLTVNEEFFGGGATTSTNGNSVQFSYPWAFYFNAGTPGGQIWQARQVNNAAPNLGQGSVTTATTTASGDTYLVAPVYPKFGSLGALGSTAKWKAIFGLALSSIATETVRAGFCAPDTTPAASAMCQGATTNSIAFRYDTGQGDTGWVGETCNASACAATTALCAINTGFHTLSLSSSVAGTISYSCDGGVAQTLSTDVPSAALLPVFWYKALGSGQRSMFSDFYRFKIIGLSR